MPRWVKRPDGEEWKLVNDDEPNNDYPVLDAGGVAWIVFLIFMVFFSLHMTKVLPWW